MRVAIVDDDAWIRRGREAVLREAGIEVVLSCDQAAALADPSCFDGVDVALVDAHDPDAGFDRYLGVRVVQAIRRRRSPEETAIVVITGHVLDDALRLRMADAGADVLHAHADIRSPEQLLALVRDPRGAAGAEPPSPQALAELGLGPTARPNDALAYVEDAGLAEAFEAAAGGESQKALPAGRRQLINARRRLADLLAAPAADPRADAKEWRGLVRLVERLRGPR